MGGPEPGHPSVTPLHGRERQIGIPDGRLAPAGKPGQGPTRGLFADRLFWAALAAGPAFWGLLLAAGAPAGPPGWILDRPAAFLGVALVYPVAEEAVFRGLIQEELARRLPPSARLGPASASNLATSVLFSALHLFTHAPLWAAGVLLPSLVLGFFKERHGGLAGPMVLHASYNAGYFLLFPPA